MGLSVNIDDGYDAAVVRVAGRIEPGNVTLLTSALVHLLHEGRARIVLDCNRLDYVSTSELPALFDLEEKAKQRGGDIKWVGLNDELTRILDLVGNGQPVRVYEDVSRAMKAFENGVGAKAA